MGIEIKEKNGKYQLKETIGGEILHDEKYVSLEVAKAVLIENKLLSVFDPIIEIDKEFPEGYTINGMYVKRKKEREYKNYNWNDFLEVIHKHDIVLDNYNNKEVLNIITDIKDNLSTLFDLTVMIDVDKSKEIILSEDNRKDILEINQKYLEGLTFHYVKTMIEVVNIALLKQKVKDAVLIGTN